MSEPTSPEGRVEYFFVLTLQLQSGPQRSMASTMTAPASWTREQVFGWAMEQADTGGVPAVPTFWSLERNQIN